jgi:riboflavin synthase
LKFLKASPLASTEALFDSTEETEVIRYYIQGIKQMKHSCKHFIEKNYMVGFIVTFSWEIRAITPQKYLL